MVRHISQDCVLGVLVLNVAKSCAAGILLRRRGGSLLLMIRKLIEQDMIINRPGLQGMKGIPGLSFNWVGVIISGVRGGTGWGKDKE